MAVFSLLLTQGGRPQNECENFEISHLSKKR